MLYDAMILEDVDFFQVHKNRLSLRHSGATMSTYSYHRDFSSSRSSFASEGLTEIHAAASAVVDFAVVAIAFAAAAVAALR